MNVGIVPISDGNDNGTNALVSFLTYRDKTDGFCTYVSGYGYSSEASSEPHYVFTEPQIWERGQTYEVGELMYTTMSGYDYEGNLIDIGVIFRCLNPHTTGTSSRTRNPAVKSNKVSWELVGTQDGTPMPFTTTVRYGVGTLVYYKGHTYCRTTYNLTGAQTPNEGTDSRYWVCVDPSTP